MNLLDPSVELEQTDILIVFMKHQFDSLCCAYDRFGWALACQWFSWLICKGQRHWLGFV